MMVCIDPGHGMSNRTWGVFDPGAVGPDGTREADIVLAVAYVLRDECQRRGWSTMLTRRDNDEHSGLGWRVSRARSLGAECIVSLHCNAHTTAQAHGVETLYRDHQWVAEAVQRELVKETGLRDRGAKPRTDLAILKYERPAVLVELGFISSDGDRAAMLDPAWQWRASRAICNGLAESVRR